MDRTTWLEARRKGIGGTDAAAILGLSPWRSAIDVWEDKLGVSAEQPTTAAMRWGLLLEDAIAGAYTEETGRKLRRVGLRRAKHVTDYPMLGSIDRMASDRLVELKTSRDDRGFADKDGWRDVDPSLRIPPAYFVQVQHYLEVVDVEVADLAVLFGGSDFRVYEIPRDRDYGSDLRAEEGAFWRDYVLTETQPPVTADDLAFLGRRHPTDDGREIVATAELAKLVDDFVALDEHIKELERSKDGTRAKIEVAMGGAARLVASSGTVSWKAHEQTRVGWKEVASAYRTMLEEALEGAVVSLGYNDESIGAVESIYSATSTVRPFRVDRKKETK